MAETRVYAKSAAVGMLVLLKYPDPMYSIGKNNPKLGTKYECSGKITDIGFYGNVRVRWDNGYENSYKDGELIIIDNPIGFCEDIW